ncbi:type VI secretion system ImpA family N-terminal domain-containing protein [Luteolibacter sp. SL250]|uniref:type VI secretion system protein TssA n=1 Tax=Luteolibacter sp. SL250 TaxID=2995170 RepID=UPI002271648C|nr:type VI secretion system ImpA family N-terminal domain-containing protein [Luteolibacter sp. SL250]WAC17861.1 type VI secretion system ImpA family N-terminal domain-containing protein [Luteolibacter sp. SL250]
MALSLEQYLAPCVNQPPCGDDVWENIVLDSELGKTLDSIVGGLDRGMVGGERESQGTGDWAGLLMEVGAHFGNTKHLGLAYYATTASLRLSQLEGLVDGIVLFNQLLHRYWLQVHPVMEDGDPDERLSLISRLDTPVVISGIDEIIIAKGRRSGSYTFAQAESSLAGNPSPTLIEASINETLSEDPEFYDRLAAQCREIRHELNALRDTLQTHLGSPSLSLPLLEEKLGKFEGFLARSAVVTGGAAPATDGSPEGGDAATPAAAVQVAQPGEIRNRADVCRTIDQLIRFYRRTEPTSPVPYLLNRAKRVAMMDFIEIVKEFRLNGSPSIDDVFGPTEEITDSN